MNQINCLSIQIINKDETISSCCIPLNKISGLLPLTDKYWFVVIDSCTYKITDNFNTCVKYIHGNENDLLKQFKQNHNINNMLK